ncbi:MAG: ATP-binding protein [Clostridia bacterium]|nr:ATP-binding protein [Clostridia bacterium]
MPMLLLYRWLVVFELFIAELLFAIRLHRRKLFALRFIGCFAVTEGLAALLPLVYNAYYTSFTFFLLFAVTVPMLKFCCNESLVNVLFCGIAAYTMQHLAYGVANFSVAIISSGESSIFGMYFEGEFDLSKMDHYTWLTVFVNIFAYFSAYTVFYYLYIRRIKPEEEFRIQRTGVLIIIGFALVVDILLNSIIVYYGGERSLLIMLMDIVYESLCCGFLLYIQFGLIKTGELKNELDVTQYLLREKERQYNISKDNIELINLKCHDLRHQIRSISKQKGLPADTVEEIESSISIYDAAVRTDNEVLDTVLTEKSLRCARDGISLTCVVDGRALEFMAAADVYALFGNALENAIEAVMRLNENMRNISVVVHKVGEMVSVNITNPCDGNIKLDGDGFPITSKDDKNFHGIGIRSMRKIAEKYHGICSVSVDGGKFVLNVLLSCATV